MDKKIKVGKAELKRYPSYIKSDINAKYSGILKVKVTPEFFLQNKCNKSPNDTKKFFNDFIIDSGEDYFSYLVNPESFPTRELMMILTEKIFRKASKGQKWCGLYGYFFYIKNGWLYVEAKTHNIKEESYKDFFTPNKKFPVEIKNKDIRFTKTSKNKE